MYGEGGGRWLALKCTEISVIMTYKIGSGETACPIWTDAQHPMPGLWIPSTEVQGERL